MVSRYPKGVFEIWLSKYLPGTLVAQPEQKMQVVGGPGPSPYGYP